MVRKDWTNLNGLWDYAIRPRYDQRPEKPDGQMMKVLDATKMKQALGWSPPTSLAEGLRKTVDWYATEKAVADLRV